MIEKNKDEVKVVFKNYPLSMHKFAGKAAAAALAAHEMGKFWEYHKALYKNMKKFNDNIFIEIAEGLGLDSGEFEKKMKSRDIRNKIIRDMKDAREADLSATPTVYVNGKKLRNLSVEGFQDAIDAQLEKVQ